MALKVVNNTVGPNRLVPILLVFNTFPWVNIDLPPTLLMLKYTKAVAKII